MTGATDVGLAPRRRMHVHFLGICGYAVSGAALTARAMGHRVTGSDDNAYPPTTTILTEAGVEWVNRSDPANLDRYGIPDLVVVGNQTRPDNPELARVRERGLHVVSEPEFWEELTRSRLRIAVCGTHGKTTTASLLSWMLETAGMHPGFRLGATSRDFDQSARIGSVAPWAPFVFEGDEYTTAPWDRRPKFLHTHPHLACVTVLEHDHPDVYPTFESYLAPFGTLVGSLPAEGRLVIWGDDPECVQLALGAPCAVESYGHASGTLHIAGPAEHVPDGRGGLLQRFLLADARPDAPDRYEVVLALPGEHNRLNTMAALLLAGAAGAPLDSCLEACRTFLGPTRRFEVKGVYGGITVIDDYGHHPAEVAAVVRAAAERFPDRRLLVLNVPHTYSRTAQMIDEYERCYEGADLVLVGPIEAARERGQPVTVTNRDVAARARLGVPRAGIVESAEEAIEELVSEAREGDIILCIALGGFDMVAERLSAALRHTYAA